MQKKVLLFVLFAGFSTLMLAQNTSFDWGVSVYPNYSNRRLIAFSSISEETILALEARETGRFSYSAGLIGGWKGGKAGFNFGANYMNTGDQTVRESIPEGEEAPEGADSRRMIFQNTNIEIPLELNFFHELSPGTEFYFMLGMGLTFNLDNKIKTVYYLGETKQSVSEPDETDEFRTTNYGFQTGIGIEKTFNDRYALTIGPLFQFWFRGVYVENDLNRNLYSMGLKAAFKFKGRKY